LILDDRTAAEFNVSYLSGAVRITDGEEIPGLGPQWEASREQPIVGCCSVGFRSAAMVNQLWQRGFRRAVCIGGLLGQPAGEHVGVVGRPGCIIHPNGPVHIWVEGMIPAREVIHK
jgi:rhodanese-related sulfurtransferase